MFSSFARQHGSYKHHVVRGHDPDRDEDGVQSSPSASVYWNRRGVPHSRRDVQKNLCSGRLRIGRFMRKSGGFTKSPARILFQAAKLFRKERGLDSRSRRASCRCRWWPTKASPTTTPSRIRKSARSMDRFDVSYKAVCPGQENGMMDFDRLSLEWWLRLEWWLDFITRLCCGTSGIHA